MIQSVVALRSVQSGAAGPNLPLGSSVPRDLALLARQKRPLSPALAAGEPLLAAAAAAASTASPIMADHPATGPMQLTSAAGQIVTHGVSPLGEATTAGELSPLSPRPRATVYLPLLATAGDAAVAGDRQTSGAGGLATAPLCTDHARAPSAAGQTAAC
jgi:hypothetical protein